MFLALSQIIPRELVVSVPELALKNALCVRQVSTVTQYGTRTDDCVVFNVGGAYVLVCRDLEMYNYDIDAGYVRKILDLPDGVIHLSDSSSKVYFKESEDYEHGRLKKETTQAIYMLMNH